MNYYLYIQKWDTVYCGQLWCDELYLQTLRE